MIQQLDGTLASHFEVLYRRQKLAGRSAGTIRKFRAAIGHFTRALGRAALVSDLSDQAVLDVMDDLFRRGRSMPTCNAVRSKLVALWSFLARKGLVATWPDVAKFVEPERVPVAWLEPELGRLFAACAAQPGTICGLRAGDWWVNLHYVLWDTGERVGAVMALAWGDVDLVTGWVRFRAETRKGKRRGLMRRLHPQTVERLRPWARLGHRLVFPWDRCHGTLWNRYGRILREAGLPDDRWHKLHAMRRSHASYLEQSGGDASRSLGHSSRAVTESSYLDPRIAGEEQAVDRLRRPGG